MRAEPAIALEVKIDRTLTNTVAACRDCASRITLIFPGVA